MTATSPPALRVGTSKTDITPADLSGLNPMGPSFDGVHDPIFVRVIVLDDGRERVALVGVDLLEVGVTLELRARIEAELGIPAAHVLIAPTHSHNAPRVGRTPSGGLSRAASPQSMAYSATVFDAIVATVAQAQSKLEPARIGIGRGTADVNISRDEFADGRYRLGQNPAGPSDKTVWVVAFQTVDGRPLAILLNYGVHSTVTLGTGLLGGDLAGAASRYVERRIGGDIVAPFTLGAVGDQNPRVSFEASSAHPGDDPHALAFMAADAQGLVVGAEAVRAYSAISTWRSDVTVIGAERVVTFPIKRGEDLPPDMTQDDVAEVGIRLTGLRVGDIAFAGVGGEVPTQIHSRLIAAAPLTRTILVSMANERIGYLTDDESHLRKTFEAKGSPVQPGAADGIVAGLADLFDTLGT